MRVNQGGKNIQFTNNRRKTHQYKYNNNNNNNNKRKPRRVRDPPNVRWSKAERVERQMIESLDTLRDYLSATTNSKSPDHPVLSFPSVRECNAALATFGDGGQFLRALGLFLKMRKCVSMVQKITPKQPPPSQQQQAPNRQRRVQNWSVPAPTLVTYSTLMSRAVQVRKPQLALRLWNLMKMQADFFNPHATTVEPNAILPDVKAANILMNVYAKLADVESAQILFEQMIHGNGTDVPMLTPNLVTYNSLLDACHKAGELDAALQAKEWLLNDARLKPDARTYTTLIATVARKASKASGAFDPTLAFSLLQEMNQHPSAQPNGMTYSALIDVCGRCQRADLAVKGLRLMLQQKNEEEEQLQKTTHRQRTRGQEDSGKKYTLQNEVGAWTAAINALGKDGRLESAMRVFYSMPNFGVQPNTVTCGCLMDCLLRHGRTADSLDLLRYMKREGIKPSEVMYTSLMTSAESLVEMENKHRPSPQSRRREVTADDDDDVNSEGDSKAIELYSALMKTIAEQEKKNGDNNKAESVMLKVFLVLQEMRGAGAEPDLACYNAVLRACSRAGDVCRAWEVLQTMQQEGITPGETTWREMLRTAGRARKSAFAEQVWRAALEQRKSLEKGAEERRWKPTVVAFSLLVTAYLREAVDFHSDYETKRDLYKRVIAMYRDIMAGGEKRKIDKEALLGNTRAVQLILQAIVSLEVMEDSVKHKTLLRKVGMSLVKLDCWREGTNPIDRRQARLLQTVARWEKETT